MPFRLRVGMLHVSREARRMGYIGWKGHKFGQRGGHSVVGWKGVDWTRKPPPQPDYTTPTNSPTTSTRQAKFVIGGLVALICLISFIVWYVGKWVAIAAGVFILLVILKGLADRGSRKRRRSG